MKKKHFQTTDPESNSDSDPTNSDSDLPDLPYNPPTLDPEDNPPAPTQQLPEYITYYGFLGKSTKIKCSKIKKVEKNVRK